MKPSWNNGFGESVNSHRDLSNNLFTISGS